MLAQLCYDIVLPFVLPDLALLFPKHHAKSSSVEVLRTSADNWLELKSFQISKFGAKRQILIFGRTSIRYIFEKKPKSGKPVLDLHP